MSVYTEIEVPILPCPWCGQTDKLVEHKADYSEPGKCVQCERCSIDGPFAYSDGPTAIEIWNKRAPVVLDK